MFKRRDIPPVLLLLLLIILVMLTLSQILVVHNGRYGKNIHSMRKLQLELRQMDINLHTMMMQNVPSIELNRRLLQNSINAQRVAHIIAEAAQPDRHFGASRRARPGGRNATRRWNRTRAGVLIASRTVPSNGSGTTTLDFLIKQQARDAVSVRSREAAAEAMNEDSVEWRSLETNALHGVRSELGVTSSVDSNFRAVDLSLPNPNRTVAPVQSSTHLHRFQRPLWSPEGAAVAEVETREPSAVAQGSGNGTSTSAASSIALPVFVNSTDNDLSVNGTSSVALGSPSLPFPPSSTSSKPYCPPVPPGIKGRIFINFEHKHDYTEEDIIGQNPELLGGGAWRPRDCIARHKVAIIIPYRDRKEHLTILLSHLHPMLQRQQLDYRIYVVEQYGDYTFNKARIMNIAFVEALKQHSFQCFVFHDVDLVPEDDRNMYSCPMQPRHMSVAIDEMGYKLAYQELVGGVLNMRTEHFQSVNGYSNLYWGWGAEDDDMAYRIMYVGLKITRPPESVARYKMIKHTKRKPSDWRKRAKLLYTGTRRFQFDGLNSLQYKLLSIENNPLCTHILVDIGKPPKGF